MKIFISSTYEDLKEYRQTAIEVVNRYKCVPLAMEFLVSEPGEPLTVCEKEVRECDIFIGIYAHRYGFIPKRENKSITQLEYELAKELGKDCLCFIVEVDYPWKKSFIEFGKQKELDDFLDKVKTENICSFFTTVHDFDRKLSTSLGKLRTKTEKKPCIPIAPTPFIAHPYPLPKHFIGRSTEQAMLSNWFYNEKEPVLVMEAIGGMGKSALTWVWMQNEIIEKRVEVEGVFWWSFYEAPFDTFIQQLSCYVLAKDEEKSLLSDDVAKLQAALHSRRFLLVLDGLERALRGYSSMNAMFIQEERFEEGSTDEIEWDKRQREPLHPMATRFLKHLTANTIKTKALITTRLMPTSLEDFSGVKHVFFKGLSRRDTVNFLRIEGIKGNRAELEQAGNVYDYHPLMLKLLTSAIKRSRTKDINEAFRLQLIDRKDPHKILSTSFNLLSEKERHIATCISVFRSAFLFDSCKALFPNMKEGQLWRVMLELRNLGFLFYDEKEDRFDLHPILRSFLYDSLTNRDEVHTRAVQYFQAIPMVANVFTLNDLAPVIELYHHLVKAEKFNKARKLYHDRIATSAYYQLSAYHLIIELLNELFLYEEDKLPRLEKESDQAWTLNELANAYSLFGQPSKAIPLYLLQNKIREHSGNKNSLAIGLGNIADDQLKICQFSSSIVHLRKRVDLCWQKKELIEEIIDTSAGFEVAVGLLNLGRVLSYQGRTDPKKSPNPPKNICDTAEFLFNVSFKILKISENIQTCGLVFAYRSLLALFQARLSNVLPEEQKYNVIHSLETLELSKKSLAFARETVKTQFPYTRDFVRTYWLLGEALIQCRISAGAVRFKTSEIPFYDEYFQQQRESIKVKNGEELLAAERCLNEALRRCRKVNLVELESDILLAFARLEWVKNSSILPSIEENLKEAFDIAQRSGYRLKLADLHLFCGKVLLEAKDQEKLLGFTAREHLQKTKEYALDVSEFSDLYQSQDPDFYKGIPEYDMLKRGMTKEERIRNGYFVAYRIAEELEKKI